MNERIKELGVQSKILQRINGMKRYNNQDKIEKFAELIIKECVREFVRKTPVSVNVSNRARHVFEHFGVGE
jgi:DNA-directed RNA polymerase specialized sigma subunit